MMTDERVATTINDDNKVPVNRTHCPLTTALLQQPGLLDAKKNFEKNMQVSQTTTSEKVTTSLMPAVWMLMGQNDVTWHSQGPVPGGSSKRWSRRSRSRPTGGSLTYVGTPSSSTAQRASCLRAYAQASSLQSRS